MGVNRTLHLIGFAAMLLASAGASAHQIESTVSPGSVEACAADSDIARVTIALRINIKNTGDFNLIFSKTAKDMIYLRSVSLKGGIMDEFSSTWPPLLQITKKPPNSLIILHPGEAHSFGIHGWFFVSRGKRRLLGTLPTGTMSLFGVFDPWPYDTRNYEQLSKEWKAFGKIQIRPIVLTPFPFTVRLPAKLKSCDDRD